MIENKADLNAVRGGKGKKELLEAVRKDGLKASVGVVGSGIPAKAVMEAVNNMKKDGITKL